MSGESLIVNSDQSKAEMHTLIDDNFDTFKYTVYEYITGKDRTRLQNNLINRLYRCIGVQRYCGFGEARAECKLTIGMPILGRDSIEFRRMYNQVIKPLSYENRLKVIEVMEIPVSSLMKVDQAKEYINIIFEKYGANGVTFEDSDYGLRSVVMGDDKLSLPGTQ